MALSVRQIQVMNSSYTCPKCASNKLKRVELPNLLLLHWVINPGLAVNELLLGQRVPKLSLECQECKLPLLERSLVPCPHCGVVHDARLWAGKSAFGNWLGPVCPSCSHRIPALWGLASRVVLAMTSPVWYLPYRFYFRDRPAHGPSTIIPPNRTASPRNSVKMGLNFSFILFLAGSAVPTLENYWQTGVMDTHRLVVGLLTASFSGLVFGGVMHWFLNRPVRQSTPK